MYQIQVTIRTRLSSSTSVNTITVYCHSLKSVDYQQANPFHFHKSCFVQFKKTNPCLTLTQKYPLNHNVCSVFFLKLKTRQFCVYTNINNSALLLYCRLHVCRSHMHIYLLVCYIYGVYSYTSIRCVIQSSHLQSPPFCHSADCST